MLIYCVKLDHALYSINYGTSSHSHPTAIANKNIIGVGNRGGRQSEHLSPQAAGSGGIAPQPEPSSICCTTCNPGNGSPHEIHEQVYIGVGTCIRLEGP